jgi:hypothetical protein
LFLLGVLASCVHEPPPDPLLADRQRLAALKGSLAGPDFPPEARLVLSSSLMRGEVQQAVDDAAVAVTALRFEVPFFGSIAVKPQVRVTEVRAETEGACADCIALLVSLDGVLAPETQGATLPGLRFEGTARGVFRLSLVEVGEQGVPGGYSELRAIAADGTDAAGRKGWSAKVNLVDLPPALSTSVSDSASGFLQRLMESEVRPDLLLASLPGDGPLRLRGVRPHAKDGAVVVDVAFVALDAGIAEDLTPPAEGFELQVPEATLLALIRAETLRMPPQDGHVIDAIGLSVDGERFVMELAVITVAKEPTRRDVRVEGTMRIADGALSLTPERTTQVKRSGGFDPFELIVRAAILNNVERALRLAIPVSQATPMGGRTRTARVLSVVDAGASIRVVGAVDAVARPEQQPVE